MKNRICDLCDGKKLCEFMKSRGAFFTCREVMPLLEEIIAKNIETEENN